MTNYTADDKDMLRRHDEILRGNGNIGLRAEVKRNSEYMMDVKDAIKWVSRAGVGILILQILDLIIK
jgi:hypothetical protein